MRYYIVDNQGNIYGDYADRTKAELQVDEHKDVLKAEGKTDKEIEALELEVIEGN